MHLIGTVCGLRDGRSSIADRTRDMRGMVMGQTIAQGVNYLKKCVIVLRWAERLESLTPLCGRLIKEGITCRALLSEELSLPPDVRKHQTVHRRQEHGRNSRIILVQAL